ncbi:MAG TPA: hypothetical protein VNN10_07825 [Dehalococcoidia bacterium]|nr:hypothetical protein [Dehalococcoidia bacterium]
MALDEEDIRQLILSRLDSGEWWLLVDIGESELARIIQERHYASDAREDFEMIFGPQMGYFHPVFYLMRKSRMSAAELAKCVADAGGEALPVSAYEQRPWLFAPRKTAPAVLVERFYEWLSQGRSIQAARASNA